MSSIMKSRTVELVAGADIDGDAYARISINRPDGPQRDYIDPSPSSWSRMDTVLNKKDSKAECIFSWAYAADPDLVGANTKILRTKWLL